jgi:flagellar basal-body rod protein FlgB
MRRTIVDNALIFDRTIQSIQDRLNLVSLNHRLVSGNLANASTPGYVAKELSFQRALQDSMQEQKLVLAASNHRHLATEASPAATIPAEIEEKGPVSVEREMMKLANNSVEYQYMVTMLNKKFALLKHAVSEGAA